MRTRIVTASGCLPLTLMVAPSGTLAGPYFPLDDGLCWDYLGARASTSHVEIGGTQLVLGARTTVRTVTFSGANSDSIESYWTETPDGDVLIHGAQNFTAGLKLAYDPPILILDLPLDVGTTWSTTFQPYYDLEGDVPWGEPLTIHYTVFSARELQVPAGTFFAYEIGQFVPAPLSDQRILDPRRGTRQIHDVGAINIFGEPLSSHATAIDTHEWYAAGVGLVRFGAFEVFELVSFGGPDALEPNTWARIKGLYRF